MMVFTSHSVSLTSAVDTTNLVIQESPTTGLSLDVNYEAEK